MDFAYAPGPASETVAKDHMRNFHTRMALNPIGRHAAWRWMKDHWDQVAQKLNTDLRSYCLKADFHCHASRADVDDIGAFFKDRETGVSEQFLATSKEAILSRSLFRERDSEELRQWLRDNNYI